ncbi:MAG: FHA domain-containing protein [Planctomycetota bacterium]|nr:MAG: FHA domain-containing protein [Planctomycetota bacterium]
MATFLLFSHCIKKVEIDGPVTTIGRDKESHLVIPDKMLSRKHCLIEKDGDTYKVIDLKSSNGTFVNGVRVKSKEIHPEDRIKIGESILYYLPF